MIPTVHLAENPLSNPDSQVAMASPITAPANLRGISAQVIAYLNVVKSKRYQPRKGATYCNIFAYDYCYLMNKYLPRVWWVPGAVDLFLQGKTPKAKYGETVLEQNANSLHFWLKRYGSQFGWKEGDVDTVQSKVNEGAVGVICAVRRNKRQPGHISVVVPETEHYKATRKDDKVVIPLQCQAGVVNFNYQSGHWPWWREDAYSDFVACYNE